VNPNSVDYLGGRNLPDLTLERKEGLKKGINPESVVGYDYYFSADIKRGCYLRWFLSVGKGFLRVLTVSI